MPHTVECTSYIQGNNKRWSAGVQGLMPFLSQEKEQIRGSPPFPEAVLPVGEEVLTVQVACQLFSNNSFQGFAEDRQQGYWPVVRWVPLILLFVDGRNPSLFPGSGPSARTEALLKDVCQRF